MELKKASLLAFKSSLLFFSIAWIACSSSHQTVKPEDRIALSKDILDRGFWKSGDILLEYHYVKSPDVTQLSLQGSAKVKLMDEFKVWVLFLDADGKILKRKLVYASGYRSNSSIGRQYYRSFKNTFEMSPKATYLAFRSFVRPRVGRDP